MERGHGGCFLTLFQETQPKGGLRCCRYREDTYRGALPVSRGRVAIVAKARGFISLRFGRGKLAFGSEAGTQLSNNVW